jgi:anti-sigma-K factor RskA
MNAAPTDLELLNRLAAEYVLGTLRGPARRRLERWRTVSSVLDERCRFWEDTLLPLLLPALRPVQPPPRVWQAVAARLGSRAPARRIGALRYALAAGVLIVLGIGALLYWRALTPVPAQVANIAAPSGTVMWRVEIYSAAGGPSRLSMRADTLAAAPAGHDYELWALPKGGAPVSLGLLPYRHNAARRTLTVTQRQALANATQLAVSLEPSGGSPTGQPTGAVVFVAPLRSAG